MIDNHGWRIFGIELTARALDAIVRDAEARYPAEACGVVFGPSDRSHADQVVPIANVTDGPGTFRFDERQHLEALARADESGRVDRVVYHSHPDAGAYLSSMDRAAIAPGGHVATPDVVHLVVEVRGGRVGEMAAFHWNPEKRAFDEAHPAVGALPDLELRAGPASEPIAPVGGRLAARRLGPGEVERFRPLAEGHALRLDARALGYVTAFELGALSPLTGFQRPDEARTVRALGRTPEGVAWRTPVELQVELPFEWSRGLVVELCDEAGQGRALMVLAEARPVERGSRRMQIGGPIYVYPTDRPDVRDRRAALLAAGARRVLAVPSWSAEAARRAEVEFGFDRVLHGVGAGEADGSEADLPLLELPREPWLTAAMASTSRR